MTIKDAVIICDNCKIPLVFKDVSRTYNMTRGIYECPKCKRTQLH